MSYDAKSVSFVFQYDHASAVGKILMQYVELLE